MSKIETAIVPLAISMAMSLMLLWIGLITFSSIVVILRPLAFVIATVTTSATIAMRSQIEYAELCMGVYSAVISAGVMIILVVMD